MGERSGTILFLKWGECNEVGLVIFVRWFYPRGITTCRTEVAVIEDLWAADIADQEDVQCNEDKHQINY